MLSAAQFRSAGFLLPGLLNAAHFLQSGFSARYCNGEHNSKNSFFVVVIPDTFQKSHPKLRPQIFCAKNIFFALLPAAHCSAAHSPVVRQRTAGLESTAQFCCNFRHSYTLFLNIYKYSLKFPKTKNAYFRRGKRNVLNVTIIDTRRTIWYYTLNELRDTFREIRMLF